MVPPSMTISRPVLIITAEERPPVDGSAGASLATVEVGCTGGSLATELSVTGGSVAGGCVTGGCVIGGSVAGGYVG